MLGWHMASRSVAKAKARRDAIFGKPAEHPHIESGALQSAAEPHCLWHKHTPGPGPPHPHS